MTKNHKNYFIVLLTIGLFFVLNGCATNSLWKSYQNTKKNQLSAESNQIYYSCIDELCEQEKFLIPYKIEKKNSPKNNFPSFEKGYLIIDNCKCLGSISKSLKHLLKDPLPYKTCSINARLTNTIALNKSQNQSIRFEIRAKLKENPKTYLQFNEHPDLYRYRIINRNHFDGTQTGTVLSKGMTIFSLGNDKCTKREFGRPANITFIKDIGFTFNSDNWKPIIDKKNSVDISIIFINEKIEKEYNQNVVTRVALTPVTLLTDIIVTPVVILVSGPPK